MLQVASCTSSSSCFLASSLSSSRTLEELLHWRIASATFESGFCSVVHNLNLWPQWWINSGWIWMTEDWGQQFHKANKLQRLKLAKAGRAGNSRERTVSPTLLTQQLCILVVNLKDFLHKDAGHPHIHWANATWHWTSHQGCGSRVSRVLSSVKITRGRIWTRFDAVAR